MVKINNKVWQQEIQLTDGQSVALSLLVKKYAVLYFYPRANTPGCTTESQDFTAEHNTFKALNCEIFGVSMDSLKKQQNFKNKHELPFPLLADEEKEVINAFGVWGPKKVMGKEYDGIHRTTFVIDENGILTDVIEKVKTKEHASQILV